jgi:hypothetical protein
VWRASTFRACRSQSSLGGVNSYGPVAPHRQAEILNALVDIKPVDANGPTQIVKLADDQVRLILNQLAKANAKEEA